MWFLCPKGFEITRGNKNKHKEQMKKADWGKCSERAI